MCGVTEPLPEKIETPGRSSCRGSRGFLQRRERVAQAGVQLRLCCGSSARGLSERWPRRRGGAGLKGLHHAKSVLLAGDTGRDDRWLP